MNPRHAAHGGSHPPGRRRGHLPAGRAAGAAGASLALALVLAGCANQDGVSLARQACRHVDRSLALYRTSLQDEGAQASGVHRQEAMAQLRQALPLASGAAGDAGEFQGLMSTLAESDHLPESLLVHALSAQCAAAQSNGVSVAPATTGGDTPPTRPPPVGA